MALPKDLESKAVRIATDTNLSEREAQVLVLMRSGTRSHEAIAAELDISESTVNEYVRRINEKRQRAEKTIIETENESHRGSDSLDMDKANRLRGTVSRLEADDRILFTSTGRPTMKEPYTVKRVVRTSTPEGTETRVEADGPRGGEMELLAEPGQSRPWQVYAQGAHEDDPVRWELRSLAIVAGKNPIEQ